MVESRAARSSGDARGAGEHGQEGNVQEREGHRMKRGKRIVVVGGGVIGCSVAYYAAQRGLNVTLIDNPKLGRATSASAVGLWPLGESLGLGCGVIFHK